MGKEPEVVGGVRWRVHKACYSSRLRAGTRAGTRCMAWEPRAGRQAGIELGTLEARTWGRRCVGGRWGKGVVSV